MSITGGSTSFIDIQPSNSPSNSLISYRDGNPVVSFVIAEQDRYLIGSSLRIAGNLAVYESPSGDHGVVPDVADNVRINPKLGVYGMIKLFFQVKRIKILLNTFVIMEDFFLVIFH